MHPHQLVRHIGSLFIDTGPVCRTHARGERSRRHPPHGGSAGDLRWPGAIPYCSGMGERPLRLVLVDDHEMVLEGLKALLGRYAGRVRVVAQSANAEDAERLVTALDPDVVVSDVRLRGALSGLDLCRRLVERDP